MSNAEGRNNKRPGEQEVPPTASFGDAVARPGGQVGQFRIKRELGRGGAGVVYLAHDTKLDRSVAIKSLPAELMDNPKARSRFAREARVLASLNHPNIATIYEELKEAEGVGYLVLEYVPGDTLAERIRRGRLEVEEALTIGLQIAEAVAAAHEHGVIHRDLKAGNIKITPEGKVKVLDFGLAKAVGGETLDQQSTITQPGQVMGTPSYMSPEQVRGEPTDERSDIWSFGCVLYEMLTAKVPFTGKTISDTMAGVLERTPDWEALPAEAGPEVRKMLYKCLEKDPDSRYQSAAQVRRDLYSYEATLSDKAFDVRLVWRAIRRPRVAVCIILILLTLGFGISWLMHRSSKVRWARVEAIPEIVRLIEQDKYLAAFSLARQAERYIPKDPMLTKLWPDMSRDYSVITTPPGADILFKEYSDIEGQWLDLGQSPLENIRFPIGIYRWEIRKEGFETVECVAGGWTDSPKPLKIDLQEKGNLPPRMVSIPARTLRVRLGWVSYVEPVEAPAYWIDKYEVRNEQFKEFVDNGGYERQEYWKHKFIKDGRELTWEEAMREFRDKMGRPGPSTWEGGTYPKGQEKYPVCGISWYEAAAYAEFAGKSLPTIYHWSTAARTNEGIAIIPFSNFGTGRAAPVGSHPGIGLTGLYDMAGNVKEWCWNATDDSGDSRYILGGAWGEQSYQFSNADFRPAWDRAATNGFRCVQYPDGEGALPDALFRPIERVFVRDYSRETPASDEDFQFYKKLYAYDRTELNAVVESVDDSSEYWRKEKITFDAAYGGERVIAYLFLPEGVKPPYQTVVYFPGGPTRDRVFKDLPQSPFTEFVIKSGRALLFPVYKGLYERQIVGGRPGAKEKPIAYRDWVIQFSKDLMRSIDYLETRDDIDGEKIAYYGMSWGGWLAPIMLVVEERIKLGICAIGGFPTWEPPDAADPINFAPRVKVPILMVNGKEDIVFPLKTSQIPMYELLGTADEHKEHIVYPGGHGLLGLFSRQIRGDVLGWLDRYLGPVD